MPGIQASRDCHPGRSEAKSRDPGPQAQRLQSWIPAQGRDDIKCSGRQALKFSLNPACDHGIEISFPEPDSVM